jgi:hypothetical protein
LRIRFALREVRRLKQILPEGKIEKCPECGLEVVSYGDIYEGLQFEKELGKRFVLIVLIQGGK